MKMPGLEALEDIAARVRGLEQEPGKPSDIIMTLKMLDDRCGAIAQELTRDYPGFFFELP